MEKITCTCHTSHCQKIIAERDRHGNIWVLCRGCKRKVKIEVLESRIEPKPTRVAAHIF
jgi:hypothetical protein